MRVRFARLCNVPPVYKMPGTQIPPLTVSELIAKLQDVLNCHGDLTIYHVAYGDLATLHTVHVDTMRVLTDPERTTFVVLE